MTTCNPGLTAIADSLLIYWCHKSGCILYIARKSEKQLTSILPLLLLFVRNWEDVWNKAIIITKWTPGLHLFISSDLALILTECFLSLTLCLVKTSNSVTHRNKLWIVTSTKLMKRLLLRPGATSLGPILISVPDSFIRILAEGLLLQEPWQFLIPASC